MIRVLVCGGRDFSDEELLTEALDYFHARTPFSLVIEGAARGADSLAHKWAIKNKIASLRIPANWRKYDKSAGVIRNKEMLEEGQPDMVVAFPGGSGTDHMKSIADKAGVPVYEITRDVLNDEKAS